MENRKEAVMNPRTKVHVFAVVFAMLPAVAMAGKGEIKNIQLGPRPFYLVEKMDEGRAR
jgi:hypothetical protein